MTLESRPPYDKIGTVRPVNARDRFRAHPLDGAMLYFHPATGTHVRVATDATRELRRRAPRVAMFGITNHCNLRCSFCSRDVGRASGWTVDSAHAVLAGLAEAGTLEVAFGGGEPFLFRGFVELLLRLHETTTLALHVTTNGTRFDAVAWPKLRGVLGQVRLSIYDEVDWRSAARALSALGQRWGANVLVDDAALATLDAKLHELARLGARDVSLLSYVGPEPERQLSAAGESRLAAIIERAPVAVRLSVCLGTRVDVPRLFHGADDSGDCGAGRDFVSITPDRRVQSCSFQDESFPIDTAADVLRVWTERREALLRSSARHGCARARRDETTPPAAANVRVWRAFSGNNSGECIMVARFATTEEAEKYLAELASGFVAGEAYSPPWKELFERERVATPTIEAAQTPDELVGAGRAVFARVHQAPDDAFPELRALAWKRGGEVLAGGIHEHDEPWLLFVMRTRTAGGGASATATLEGREGLIAVRHGALLLGAMPSGNDLAEGVSFLREAARGEPVAQEIWCGALDRQALEDEAKRLAVAVDESPRMAFTFWDMRPDAGNAKAAAFVRHFPEVATARAENTVLAEIGGRKRKRLAVLGHRGGAFVHPLLARRVIVHASMWEDAQVSTAGQPRPAPPPLERAAMRAVLEPRLRAALGSRPFELSCEDGAGWRPGVTMKIESDAPREVLEVLATAASELPGVSAFVGVEDAPALALALRRLIEEVHSV